MRLDLKSREAAAANARRNYPSRIMTPRWAPIAFFVFGLAWLTFGIWELTEGDTGAGVARLALGVGWLLLAAFKGMRPSVQDGRRSGTR
jgi:succinate-acetate transporter protein